MTIPDTKPMIARTFPSWWVPESCDKPIAEKTIAIIPTIPKKFKNQEIIPRTNPAIIVSLTESFCFSG